MGEQSSRQTGNERKREMVRRSSSRNGESQQRQRVWARRARDDHGERGRERCDGGPARAGERRRDSLGDGERGQAGRKHTRTTGGGAAARAPLRAAGRRCLPLLRMRLILVERSLRVVSHRQAERADSARGLRSRLARASGAAAASAAAAPPRPPPTPWAFGPAAVRA